MESATDAIPTDRTQAAFWRGGMLAVLGIAAFTFALHLLFNNRYGYFRDEFDYIICGRHLAWGYVDQPPLLPLLSRIFLAIFGESLRAVRLLPALSSAALVVLTGFLTRELGGKRFAVALSAVAILCAGIYLSGGSLLTANCDLEVLLWMGCAYCAILAVKRSDARYWVWFGIVAGVGLEEKYSILVFGFALVIGLLLTRQRRLLLNKWIWLGGLAAFLIFLPNLLWNIKYDWPFVQLMHNIRADGRDIPLTPWQYVVQQVLLIFPVSAPLWITGVVAFLISRRFVAYRFLGWAYLISLTVFIVLHGKNYYLAPIYPVYLAAGSVVIDDAIDRIRQPWIRSTFMVSLLVGAASAAPLSMPILSVDHYIAYMKWYPAKPHANEYSHLGAVLPQHFADQFGWDEIVQGTLAAWNKIPPAERKDCGIFAQDYGQAGAIDFLGPKYGLPNALSGDRTYWLWGPRGYSGNCMIVLNDTQEVLETHFEHVEYVGRTPANPYALEQQLTVFICHGFKHGTWADVWPKLKRWR